jgi:hypothetical protein
VFVACVWDLTTSKRCVLCNVRRGARRHSNRIAIKPTAVSRDLTHTAHNSRSIYYTEIPTKPKDNEPLSPFIKCRLMNARDQLHAWIFILLRLYLKDLLKAESPYSIHFDCVRRVTILVEPCNRSLVHASEIDSWSSTKYL